jgi:hypothetical protein
MASNGISQNGFIRYYDIENRGSIFTNLLLKDDTLIATGLASPSSSPFLQAMLFAKLDTFGNILEYKTHLDSLGNNYVVGNVPSGFIRLSDNSGYLLLGAVFETTEGIIMKLDINGDPVFVKEYPDNLSLADFYEKVIELPDGFIVAGDKSYIPGNQDVFIMKTDKEGNKLWEKRYGTSNHLEAFSDMLQTEADELVIAGIKNSPVGTPWQQAEYKKWVFAVDSLGNLKWQWESEHSLEEIGINNLHKNGGGNWVYTTTNNIVEFDGYMRAQPRFVIRDSNFNIVISKLYDKPDYSQNYFENMIPMPEGGWLAVGRNNESEPSPTGLFGWIYRLDEDGDSLWSRIDTAIWDPGPEAGNSLNSVVVLPSGSIIAAGICEVFHPQPKDYGWLISRPLQRYFGQIIY